MEQQNSNIIAAIDVGTTKIVALVGRRDSEGHIEVIGYGRTESKGVRRGAVLNIEEASRSIKEAVSMAEEQSGYKITEAYVGIAGQHIRSDRQTCTKNRNSANDPITLVDIHIVTRCQPERGKPLGFDYGRAVSDIRFGENCCDYVHCIGLEPKSGSHRRPESGLLAHCEVGWHNMSAHLRR